jgi:DNA polymerase (family 10)
LLEVAGESPFRARAFVRAAEAIQVIPERVIDLANDGRLHDVPGVGAGIATAIEQILATGRFDSHEELVRRYPESLIELTTIPGVGAKTAVKLHSTLGVESLAALEAALVSGAIADTKGLGPRLASTIEAGLTSLQQRTGRTPLGTALPIANALILAYATARPEDSISLAGSARRWSVTVGDLDFVVGTVDIAAAMAAISSLAMVNSATTETATMVSLRLVHDFTADVFFCEQSEYGTTLIRATGDAHHLKRLGRLENARPTEQDVYEERGFPWIPPELRAGADEFDRWAEIPALVTRADLQGEFHAHTTWSDGKGTIRQMAAAARERGYSYLGITDHSHGLGVAGGLDVARLIAQRVELDRCNVGGDLRLLAGAEVEVSRDGTLDYDQQTLSALDIVVASLHSGLRQPRSVITDRLIAVLENPDVDIVAHPSGRLIERREGGDFDWDRVFSVAARTGTALEINADPARLDLDPHLARRAQGAGCLLTINCDAHSPSGFANMEYGVAMARRAWLKPDDILNCWERERVLSWLGRRGRAA